MRESIDIQGVGEVFLAKPRSFAVPLIVTGKRQQ